MNAGMMIRGLVDHLPSEPEPKTITLTITPTPITKDLLRVMEQYEEGLITEKEMVSYIATVSAERWEVLDNAEACTDQAL